MEHEKDQLLNVEGVEGLGDAAAPQIQEMDNMMSKQLANVPAAYTNEEAKNYLFADLYSGIPIMEYEGDLER